MVSSARQMNAETDEDRILGVARGIVAGLGPEPPGRSAGEHSHPDRDLGLGGLERVELLVRLEKTFGTRLNEDVLAGAETVQDLVVAMSNAGSEPSGVRVQEERVSRAANVSFPGQAEGLPATRTFEEVIRQRGRADAAQTHLIFYKDVG